MKSTIKLAYNHLSNDKVMSYLIDKFGDKINWGNRYNSNYALSIANLIIEQQISFKAAITVKKRFAKIVNKKSESEIMNMSNSRALITKIKRIFWTPLFNISSYPLFRLGQAR